MDDKKGDQGNDLAASLYEISADDIIRFFDKIVKNHQCPVCWSSNWTLVNDPKATLVLIGLPKSGGFSIPPPNVPVAALGCDHCGYIRQHALGVIREWLQKNPE